MRNGVFLLLLAFVTGFLAHPVTASVRADADAVLVPPFLLSEPSPKLTIDRPLVHLGEAGGIAAALGGFVARGALAPTASSLPEDQIGPGVILASIVFLAGFKIWKRLRIWTATIPLDLQSSDAPGIELPARRPFYGMPNVSTTSGLGVELNW